MLLSFWVRYAAAPGGDAHHGRGGDDLVEEALDGTLVDS
jgi:hypothetical protein